MKPRAVVVDYGMGNVDSVKRAFEECGANVQVSDDENMLRQATHLVLPGVGAFPSGMKQLRERGLDILLGELALQRKVPLLGICLGMQLLAKKGTEGKPTEGLGFVDGEVTILDVGPGERLPHMGWNEVCYEKEDPLFVNIPTGTDFYFVHSFHIVCKNSDDVLATTPYGGSFTSVVRKGRVFGTQFHPEKSQKPGFQLIKNFLAV